MKVAGVCLFFSFFFIPFRNIHRVHDATSSFNKTGREIELKTAVCLFFFFPFIFFLFFILFIEIGLLMQHRVLTNRTRNRVKTGVRLPFFFLDSIYIARTTRTRNNNQDEKQSENLVCVRFFLIPFLSIGPYVMLLLLGSRESNGLAKPSPSGKTIWPRKHSST